MYLFKKNVHLLQTDIKARWQGYLFFFKEGFCYSDISDTRIRCRMKDKGVYDVKSMSLFSASNKLPDWYFICILNSSFIGKYIKDMLNNTVSFQINDARQIPILIPSKFYLESLKNIFDNCVNIQKKKFLKIINNTEAEKLLLEYHLRLDSIIMDLYDINL